MKRLIVLLLFLISFVLIGCGGGGTPDDVTQISNIPTDLGINQPDSL